MSKAAVILRDLVSRYPELVSCAESVQRAFELLKECFEAQGKLLLCGNGGSCADCAHITGELMKGFCKNRPLSEKQKLALAKIDSKNGYFLAEKLQQAFPVVDLCANTALITAVANDTDADLIFAQQIMGLGREKDVLLCICPKGSAPNVLNAIAAARLQGMKVIGMVAQGKGAMANLCDGLIAVPQNEVFLAQEMHLPVYHALCLMLEAEFFSE